MAVDTSRENPRHIFLEPECCADPSIGRCWAAHNEWPLDDCDAQAEATQYVRADLVAALERERDAAIAERDRLAGAMRGLMAGSVWQETHLFIDGTPIPEGWSNKRMPSDEALTAARAALASITKEPTDGE